MKYRFIIALLFAPLLSLPHTSAKADPGEHGWALDPGAVGAQRDILEATMKILFKECPALADLDFELVTRQEHVEEINGDRPRFYEPLTFRRTHDKRSWALEPPIESWEYMASMLVEPSVGDHIILITTSWIDPAGIAIREVDGGIPECDLEHYGKDAYGEELYFRPVPALGELQDLLKKAEQQFIEEHR